MTKPILLTISILLLLTVKVLGQRINTPVQGITLGYYNDKFGSHGVRAGYERPVWQNFHTGKKSTSIKHAFVLKANINFYNHKRHHNGLSLNTMIGYRYTSQSGLTIEPLHLGIGYHQSFLNGKTYEVKPDGGFQEVKLAGNSTLILPYIQLIGLGYDLRQKINLPFSFIISIDPYFQHSVNTQLRIRLATPITITYFFK